MEAIGAEQGKIHLEAHLLAFILGEDVNVVQPGQEAAEHTSLSRPVAVLTKEQAMLRPALVALCAATIATGAMGQSTGIAFCDDFIKKFEVCYTTKMPADQQDLHKLTLDHMRKTVSDLAKGSGGKSSAENLCKEMLAGVKGLLGSVGCTF